ncbi:hypothetical protein NL676_034694 [Syzygium grande]|nr:hypothetical protein NL676_034694 [Syzygium grande]
MMEASSLAADSAELLDGSALPRMIAAMRSSGDALREPEVEDGEESMERPVAGTGGGNRSGGGGEGGGGDRSVLLLLRRRRRRRRRRRWRWRWKG